VGHELVQGLRMCGAIPPTVIKHRDSFNIFCLMFENITVLFLCYNCILFFR